MRSSFYALLGGVSLVLVAGCMRHGKSQPPVAISQMPAACQATSFDAVAVERKAAPATLLVITSGGMGSGFVIRDGTEQLITSATQSGASTPTSASTAVMPAHAATSSTCSSSGPNG